MNMRDRLTESVGKPHLSYSSLKYALGDMRLWEMYMRGQLKKESQALTFGSLYDMMLFEPENVRDRFYCLDDSDIVATIGGRNPRNTKSTVNGRQKPSRRRRTRTRNWLARRNGRQRKI